MEASLCELMRDLEAIRKQKGMRNLFLKAPHDSGTKKRWRCYWGMMLGLSLSGLASPGDSHMQDLYWVMHIRNLAPTELLKQ